MCVGDRRGYSIADEESQQDASWGFVCVLLVLCTHLHLSHSVLEVNLIFLYGSCRRLSRKSSSGYSDILTLPMLRLLLVQSTMMQHLENNFNPVIHWIALVVEYSHITTHICQGFKHFTVVFSSFCIGHIIIATCSRRVKSSIRNYRQNL